MYSKRYLLLFLIIINYLNQLNAQRNGDELFSLADSLFEIDEYDIARDYFRQAKSVYESKKLWNKATESLNGIINTTIYKDEYEEVIKELYPEVIYYNSLKEVIGSYQLGRSFHLIAYSKENLGEYSNALEDYEKAIEIYESLDSINYHTTYTYRSAAQIALRMLDYSKAITYFKKGLLEGENGYYYASICGQLAKTYLFLNDFDSQYKYLQFGLNANPRPLTKAILHVGLSEYMLNKKNYEAARKYIDLALDYYNKAPRYVTTRMNLELINAKIFERQGLDEKAKHIYSKIKKEVFQNENLRSRGKTNVLISLAKQYFENHNIDQSLFYYQNALIQIFPDFDNLDVFQNPSLGDVYRESWLLDAAAGKAKALKKKFELDANIKNLKVAADCYNIVIEEINMLVKSYGTEYSKIYLGGYSYNYFEEAIEIQSLLFEKTQDEKYLEKIFFLMERSKAVVLMEAIQDNKAIIEASIPDTLLSVEKGFRYSIAEKKVEIIKLKQQGIEEHKIEAIELELADLLTMQKKFIKSLKDKYPNFHSKVESYIPPSLNDVQTFVKKEKTLFLEYFVGEINSYVLMISENRFTFVKLKTQKTLNKLIYDFSIYFKNPNQFLNDRDNYFEHAYQLYSILFSDLLSKGLTCEKILIIPDGELINIPFEALVFKKDINEADSNYYYLLNKYLIYYSNSANLFFNTKQKSIKGDYFLNIAPGFLEQERNLTPLAYSFEETECVNVKVNLLGKKASLTSFKENVENAEVIHLSTHASIGEVEKTPKIEFIDTTLFLPEIYSFNLKADLVVLSACESQLGKLEKGEGIMSLGRGFFYGGASSLIASLWNVNEKSTSEIFSSFYKYLQNDIPKAEALHKAKLNYIKSAKSDLNLGPYYWAGFVYFGKNEVVEFPSTTKYSKLFLGGGALSLILFFLYFFRKTNN